MLSESYLVDEMDLCCWTVARWGRRVVGVGKPARSVPGNEGARKVSRGGGFWEDGGDDGAGERVWVARIADGPVELQCVRKSIRWCGRSLLAFQICGTSKECRATCLKPYRATQIAGPLARAPAEMAATVHGTHRRGPRHQVPVGDQIEHLPGQASERCCDAGLRCWPAMLACDCGGGDRISNPKSQASQANSQSVVCCPVVGFGSQKREARKLYKRKIAS